MTGPEKSDLEPYLSSGERLVWIGRPHAWRVVFPTDRLAVDLLGSCLAATGLFSASVGFLSMAHESVLRTAAPVNVVLVFLCSYLLAGRFVYRLRRANRTMYAVTNQRVISFTTWKRDEFTSAPLTLLSVVATRNVGFGAVSMAFAHSELDGSSSIDHLFADLVGLGFETPFRHIVFEGLADSDEALQAFQRAVGRVGLLTSKTSVQATTVSSVATKSTDQ